MVPSGKARRARAIRLEQLAAGLVAADEITTTYAHPTRDVYSKLILPTLRAFQEPMVAEAAGVPRRTINGLRAGCRPDGRTLSRSRSPNH